MRFSRFILSKIAKKWDCIDKRRLAKQALPEDIKIVKDVTYDEAGQKEQTLDIIYPEKFEGKLPVIINIHGGGFFYGDKALSHPYCYHLAKRGFIVFTINYRLALYEYKIKQQIQDIIAAVVWIKDNLEKYPADKNNIFITGDSAGGYFAVLTAMILKNPRLQNVFDTKKINIEIQALGIVSGMFQIDNTKLAYRGLRSVCMEKGYKKQEYYQDMILEQNLEIKSLPPAFIVSSSDDYLHNMTFKFLKALDKNNVTYKFTYFKKERGKKYYHIFCVNHPERKESQGVIDKMTEFFKSKIRDWRIL